MENKLFNKVISYYCRKQNKSKHLFTLAAVFIVTAVFSILFNLNAQTGTYYYAGPESGGVPSTGYYTIPEYSGGDDRLMTDYYENAMSITFYTSDEINTSAEGIINSISFYLDMASQASGGPANITMLVKNTSTINFDDFDFTEIPYLDIYGNNANHLSTVAEFESMGWTVIETKIGEDPINWVDGSWITFNSTDGFLYTGQNLSVVIFKTADDYGYTADGPDFAWYDGGPANDGATITHVYDYWDGEDNWYDYNGEGEVFYLDDVIDLKPHLRLDISSIGQAYVSSTAAQSSVTTAMAGQTNVPVLSVQITTDGLKTPLLNLKTMSFNGVNLAGNVINAKLYYTGESNTFATSNLLGTYTIGEDNTIAFSNLTRTLQVAGANYFWLTFDMSNNIFTEDVTVDASLVNFTLERDSKPIAVNPAPTVTDPTGTITVTPSTVPPIAITVSNYTANRVADTTYIGMRINAETEVTPAVYSYYLNQLDFDLSNIGSNIDVNRIKIYYTGTAGAFVEPELVAEYENPVISSNFPAELDSKLLDSGSNYFWLVFDVAYTSECDAVITPVLLQATFEESTYNKDNDFVSDIYGAQIIYDPIILNTITDNPVCELSPNATFTVNHSGSIAGFAWEVWNEATQSYQGVSDNTTNQIEVTLDQIRNGMTKARLTGLAPAGDCITPATIELLFRESVPVSNPVVTFDGVVPNETEVFSMCMDGSIAMDVDYEGNAAMFEWQWLDENDNWQTISLADVPTSDMEIMDFIPSEKFRNTKIRVKVHSETVCGTEVVSAEYPIFVYYRNNFLEQPQRTVNICAGEDIYINVVFEGEQPLSAKWYKNGRLYNDTADIVSGILNVQGADEGIAGTYQYVVTVPSCNGIETLYSSTLDIFVNPEPEIIEQTTRARANFGKVAFLKVDANYIPDTTQTEIFQWYRHYATTNTNVRLAESYNYQGTKSNVLNVVPVDDDSYTYNGDYYYCVVKGMCGTREDISEPIYLISGVDLVITKQPTSVEICENDLPNTAELNCMAFSSEDNSKVHFQWYEGATELIDDAEFTGANTNVLKVNADGSRSFDKFVCKVWYDNNDPTVDYLLTDSVDITVISCPIQEVNDLGNDNYVEVVPNPTANDVTFRFNVNGHHNYIASIIDISGKLIYSVNGSTYNGDNLLKLDVSKFNMSNGTYFFTLNINGKIISRSFAVSK